MGRTGQRDQPDRRMLSIFAKLISDHLRQGKQRIRLNSLRNIDNHLPIRDIRSRRPRC